MAEIYRVTDRFKITGRGVVYLLKMSKGASLQIDDILYDLRWNKFKVKGIEMFRMMTADTPFEERPAGILFELLSGVEVEGHILVRDITNINFIFCNHPLYECRVDEDYQQEYQEAGLDHACALFSYEDLEQGRLSLYGEKIEGLTIYRGWMMKPDMYRDFYEQLEKKNIILINSPEEYEKYHMLPGWYDDFREETARSVWTKGTDISEVKHISRMLEGAYIVKDYVKSRKHEWYDACFIKNIRDENNLEKIVGNFISRQGTDLVGGIVLRRYENLKQIGFHEQSGMPLSEEYRAFIYAGRILSIDSYWTDKAAVNLSEDEHKWVESIAHRVRSNFVTVDLARKENGSLIIMEFGDGQVSGLQQLKAEAFYRGLNHNV